MNAETRKAWIERLRKAATCSKSAADIEQATAALERRTSAPHFHHADNGAAYLKGCNPYPFTHYSAREV